MDTFKNIFESLVGEADYNKFDAPPSPETSAVGTSQHQTDITGSGEDHGIDSGRVARKFDATVLSELGLEGGARVNNMIEREFIVAQIYRGLRDRGNRKVRLVYPSLDILGAVSVNPTVLNADGENVKKFQVVNTAEGKTEEERPVYYTINIKTKDRNKFGRREHHNARNDNQSFASEMFNDPQDYTSAFGDSRLVQKTRDNDGADPYVQDASSVGAGLVPQKSASGIAISNQSGTNTVSKHVFVATRSLKVGDLKRFITRKGASNGIAGHFILDAVFGPGKEVRLSFLQFMNRYGELLKEGRFNGEIHAIANDDIVTNRLEANPGVDNDYFYLAEDIPAPGTDETDWTPFLSELAKTSTGFETADEIFGGLDDTTVYALYAYCAIPVKLSRIFFTRLALGHERTLGLALSHNNIQNKTSSEFAKIVMQTLQSGVTAGGSYELPNGRMFVISNDKHTVDFPAEWFNNNKIEKTTKRDPMTLDVQVVTGVINTNGRDVFFRVPYCTNRADGNAFIFMRYGGNDIGPQDGDDSCSSPQSMSAGYIFSSKVPIESIEFVNPEMQEAYEQFRNGTTKDVDLKGIELPKDGDRVTVSAASYAKNQLGDKSKAFPAAQKVTSQQDIDSLTNDENIDATDSDIDRVATAMALKDAKDNDEWIDFSQPKPIWQKKVADLDAKSGRKPGQKQFSDAEIDDIMSEIDKSRQEDDRTDRDYAMVGDPNGEENEFDDLNDQED